MGSCCYRPLRMVAFGLHTVAVFYKEMTETILVAEDDTQLSASIHETLTRVGFNCIIHSDPREALKELEHADVALLLTDLKMPHMNGIELARRTLEIRPDTRIIVITAYSTINTVLESLRMGLDNYVLKPFRSEELLFNIRESLERRRLILENRLYQSNLEQMVQDQTQRLQERHQKLCRSQMESIFAIGNIVEARDTYTRGHTERVTFFAIALAERLGWSEAGIRELGIGSPLHDIGKIGIPNRVLNKQGTFTFEEFEIMKKHPEVGYGMVRGSGFSHGTVACILYHHERFDGNGYPFGLGGKDIPKEGRLMAACDAFDAMTSDRVYRPAMPVEKAADILHQEAGHQFDPEIVSEFAGLLEGGAFDAVLRNHDIKAEFEQLITRLTSI